MERLFEVEPISRRARNGGLSSAAVGAIAETKAITKLLELGHKVAIPVVDDDGVDLVVNYTTTVQVKARSAACVNSPTGTYAFSPSGSTRRYSSNGRSDKRPQVPFADVLIFYAIDIGAWWILTADQLHEAGATPGVESITLRAWPKSDSQYSRISIEGRDAWHVFDEELV